MKVARLWITAKPDEERVYTQTFPPDEERTRIMEEQGYTIFEVTVPLNFEPGSRGAVKPGVPLPMKGVKDGGESTGTGSRGNGASPQ